MKCKMIVRRNDGNDEIFECDTVDHEKWIKNESLITGLAIVLNDSTLIIRIADKIVKVFAPGTYLEYKLEESQKSSNIEALLSSVTEEIFQAFRQGGSDQWLQMFSDSRINIESVLTNRKTPTETPMIKLQCRADIFLLSEFKKIIREQLENFLKP